MSACIAIVNAYREHLKQGLLNDPHGKDGSCDRNHGLDLAAVVSAG